MWRFGKWIKDSVGYVRISGFPVERTMKHNGKEPRELAWKMGRSDRALHTRIFDLFNVETWHPSGRGPYTFTLLKAPDWMNVVPLTPEGNVVMIEQFRHGIGRVTLEIPGGQVDAGETPAECAIRELREETGFSAASVARLGDTLPNPAFLDNRCHTFLATGCVKRHEAAEEDTEAIRVRLEPLGRVPELIARGEIEHSLVVVAFTHLSLVRPDLLRL